jgi:hypothetical protein
VADNKIIPPNRQLPIVSQGIAEQRFSAWCDAITRQVNGYELKGSPEGLVDAPRFSLCANVLTDTLYIKTTSAGILTGWKEL